jgi:hypothetical protein
MFAGLYRSDLMVCKYSKSPPVSAIAQIKVQGRQSEEVDRPYPVATTILDVVSTLVEAHIRLSQTVEEGGDEGQRASSDGRLTALPTPCSVAWPSLKKHHVRNTTV